MRRLTLSAALAACLTVAVVSAVVPVAQAGQVARAMSTDVTSASLTSRPDFAGREVFKIVSVLNGPLHAPVTASGAFDATGYFVHRRASLVFPRGQIGIRRYVARTTVSGPNLATCRFTIKQTGTFRVLSATGKYRGIRESGQLSTTISGRLIRTGHDQCGSKLVGYRATTYETGIVR